MHTERTSYRAGSGPNAIECEGFVAVPTGLAAPAAVVLVCHAWGGQDDFARARAEELARAGYIGFAVDVYGKGRRGSNAEENSALMTPLVKDRRLLRERLLAAMAAARAIGHADPHRIAAIGFCFGGLCALDLARAAPSGLKGVVSFHGLFSPPDIGPQGRIGASVLCLHGYDDPMCTPDAVVALAKELTEAGADWEIDMYGHTVHAFTNPAANDPSFGTAYKKRASDRSFAKARLFLTECLGI